MVFRKLTTMVAAAFVAAFFAGGMGGVPVFGQQYSGYSGNGCSTCSNCYSQVQFPATVSQGYPVSQPLPQQSFIQSQPNQVVQTLPTTSTSSFVASTANDVIMPGQMVNETYANWQPSNTVSNTVVSGPVYSNATVVGQPIYSNPTGTFTSMPAPVNSSAIPFASNPVISSPVMSSSVISSPIVTQPMIQNPPMTYASANATPIRSTLSAGYRAVGNTVGTVTSGLAQMKADQAASGGIRGHIGGGLGGARYEGVGWSNQSPQSAVQQCCYWGTRPVSQIGVRRGADGCWYACVLYQ